MIVFEKVSKSFGEKTVLKDFSLEIAPGSTVCLSGESGAGKTTVIKLLLGLEAPDSGRITGVPEICSAVFQEDRLCESFSAVRNILIACRKVKADLAESALRELGIGKEDLGKCVGAFSGGMKRRVAIARAMLADSELVVLDEAFKGLDEDNLKKSADFVRRYARGRTIVMVSHSGKEAELMQAGTVKIQPVPGESRDKTHCAEKAGF